MSKTHEFERPYYTIEVPVMVGFLTFLLGYFVYQGLHGFWGGPALLAMFVVADAYYLWNIVVSHAYPRYVHVDDESISFELWGRTDRYELAELREFHVRSNPQNGKTFVRAGQTTLVRGRYWIATKKYTDGRELFDTLDAIEIAVHPDGLKARARKGDARYMERAERIGEARATGKRNRRKKGSKAHNAALGTKAEKKE